MRVLHTKSIETKNLCKYRQSGFNDLVYPQQGSDEMVLLFCNFAHNEFRLSSLVELFLMDHKTLLKSLTGTLDSLHLSRMGLEML